MSEKDTERLGRLKANLIEGEPGHRWFNKERLAAQDFGFIFDMAERAIKYREALEKVRDIITDAEGYGPSPPEGELIRRGYYYIDEVLREARDE